MLGSGGGGGGVERKVMLMLICHAAHFKGKCDRIICDPPFLSENCQTKSKGFTCCCPRATKRAAVQTNS